MAGELVVDARPVRHLARLPLPIEVRDARGVRVVRTSVRRALSVSAGLYHLRSLAADGAWREVVAVVTDGATTTVVVDEAGPHAPGADVPVPRLRAFTAPVPEVLLADGAAHPSDVGGDVPPDLLGVAGVSSAEVGPSWVFAADAPPASVPTARFGGGERAWTCSLPVNPRDIYPASTCLATRADRSGAPRIQVAAQRPVAATVEALVRSGLAFEAGHLMGDALRPLGSGRRDPVASVLAAYCMFDTGELAEHEGWLREIAAREPWIPDVRVLVIAVELDRGGITRTEAGQRMLFAVRDRMLLTDGLALALRILRRSPVGPGSVRRAVDQLEQQAAGVDWGAVYLTSR
jgi:hypothetical protein